MNSVHTLAAAIALSFTTGLAHADTASAHPACMMPTA